MATPDLNKAARALLEEFRKAGSGEPDVVPAGFLTLKQIAQELGLTRPGAQSRLRRVSSKVEMAKFRIRCPGGLVKLMPHYRLKT